MCVRRCTFNRESDARFFFSLFWDREKLMTQHTPLALHTGDPTCTYTQMSRGGDLFENTQAPVNVQEALGEVGTIIARLLKWGGEVTLRDAVSSGMWEELTPKVLRSKQLILTDDERFPVIRQTLPGCNKMVKGGGLQVSGCGFYGD